MSTHVDETRDVEPYLQVPPVNMAQLPSDTSLGKGFVNEGGRDAGSERRKGGEGGKGLQEGFWGDKRLVGVVVHVLASCVVLPTVEHPRRNVIVKWSLNHLPSTKRSKLHSTAKAQAKIESEATPAQASQFPQP